MLSDGSSNFLDGAGLDEHLQGDTATGSVSYLGDHLGSTSQLMDALNGSNKAKYDYTSYGKLEGDLTNPSASNPYIYTGREDDGTGLLYYRARYYDPELEVFISQDPLGDSQRYVGGNPLRFRDPRGLESDCLSPEDENLGYHGSMDCGFPEVGQLGGGSGTGGGTADTFSPGTYVEPVESLGEPPCPTELIQRAGGNSVTIDTPTQRIRVDLGGKAHYEKSIGQYVDTPHVTTYNKKYKSQQSRVSKL